MAHAACCSAPSDQQLVMLWDRMDDVFGLSISGWSSILLLVLDYGIKIVAIGVVPENRRPSSSQAWLLLILLVPVVGLPLFFLIGSIRATATASPR